MSRSWHTVLGRKRPKRQITAKVNDNIWLDARETDIVIPVMGPTGAGKSTFINEAADKQLLEVGQRMTSCTTQPCPVVIDPIPGFPNLEGRRLVLVDTPGFDDTYKEDVDILKSIAKWLENSYRKKMFLGGVLYLHDISIKKFTGTARRNLELFSRLCGEASVNKVVLVTTNWGVSSEHEANREKELQSSHWKPLMNNGAKVHRFLRDWNSAWDIIDVFLDRINTPRKAPVHAALQIQMELVDRHLIIPETQAGKELRYTLKQILEIQKEAAELEAVLAKGEDPSAKEKLEEAQKNMQKLQEQIQALKIPLPRRLRRLFGFL
ncbi:hypothetical protein GALMADRAFT_115308 [Galerina marginata CBS 339.88]|uniref:G domain-containing protein n=1 Tax=Galerina marginata (strain CBS 339.88) TaxID=685588 RepID=A0A067TBG7_GALM3|nr:hypothetical protein GALMADRAFT_115308 [Galerina marginata CBS 339.88]